MKEMVTSNPEWGPGMADVGHFSSSQRMKLKTDHRYHFSRIPPLPPKPWKNMARMVRPQGGPRCQASPGGRNGAGRCVSEADTQGHTQGQ